MPNVYAGKYLRLDLTTGEQRVETISEEDARKYYLGSGYAAMLYEREMDPSLDPLKSFLPSGEKQTCHTPWGSALETHLGLFVRTSQSRTV